MTTLRISETFTSIQGESHWAGYPCFFIRLAGCNLSCKWCDSLHALGEGETMEVDELVRAAAANGAPLVEVTGGEPLNQPGCFELLEKLCALDKRVLVETNGSLDISAVPAGIHVIMDLKPPSSGMVGMNDYCNVAKLGEADELKIVVAGREDYLWAVETLKSTGALGSIRVNLSCVQDALDPAELAGWMVEDGLDARFQLQLHRLLWPDVEQGV